VIIVGYGKETSNTGTVMSYWIVKNSWGSWWGDNGFFKMARGKNLCKIANDATYPVLKTNPPKCLAAIALPNSCKWFADLVDSTGNYIKSLCIDRFIRTYEQSMEDCYMLGMRLFQIESDDHREILINYANKNFVKIFNFNLFVSGRNESGCLSINNKNSSYVAVMENCLLKKRSVCEFLNVARECLEDLRNESCSKLGFCSGSAFSSVKLVLE
jgi:hypothetical protein